MYYNVFNTGGTYQLGLCPVTASCQFKQKIVYSAEGYEHGIVDCV